MTASMRWAGRVRLVAGSALALLMAGCQDGGSLGPDPAAPAEVPSLSVLGGIPVAAGWKAQRLQTDPGCGSTIPQAVNELGKVAGFCWLSGQPYDVILGLTWSDPAAAPVAGRKDYPIEGVSNDGSVVQTGPHDFDPNHDNKPKSILVTGPTGQYELRRSEGVITSSTARNGFVAASLRDGNRYRVLTWAPGRKDATALVFDEPSFPSGFPQVGGVNSSGQVAYSRDDGRVFVSDGVTERRLGGLPGYPPYNVAGINDGGAVAGNTVGKALIWVGGVASIIPAGADYSWAVGIGNDTTVVGSVNSMPWIWRPGWATVQQLERPSGATSCTPRAIAGRFIVGNCSNGPTLWKRT